MTTLLTDIRFGLRMLLKSPTVTIVAIVALMLGIGANTAIFSVVNAVLLRSFPYSDPEKLVLVWEKRQGGRTDQNVINLANFTDWKNQNQVFSDMAVFFDRSLNLTSDGEPEEVPGQFATINLFSVLGTNPVLGRPFVAEDVRDNQPSAVIISYGLWQRRFGRDSGIVNRQITLNNRQYTVAGVMPANFGWHIQRGTEASKPADIWVPFQIPNDVLRRGRFASAVARMKPGVTVEQAQSEMTTIAARLEQQYPDFNKTWSVNVVPLRTQFTGEIRRPLLIVLGAVGFVLLIACANVANLLLARASSRRKEIAVRAGLGANRWRIARQLLTESVLLSLIGGTLGVFVAWWGTKALVALSPPALIDLQKVRVNVPVLLFTLGLSLLTGVVFGLAPALQATRFDLQGALKEGGKNVGGAAGSHHLRNVFVVTQVALALVLLVGAGLLVKSFTRLQSVNTGFNPDNLLTVRVSVPFAKYNTDQKRIDFYQQALTQMRAIPGVESVGAINTPPFTGLYSGTRVEIVGNPPLPPEQELKTGVCVTDSNYFTTMQIPLLRGRLFTQQETTEERHVVIVNETFVKKNLNGEDPLGKRLIVHMKPENVPLEIIGVVADNKHLALDQVVEPMTYYPHGEMTFFGMTMMLRTTGDPKAVAPAARSVIRAIDPQQPIGAVTTMNELLSVSVARARFSASLLAVFSIVALVMAAVGIYGVMSYTVLQRTHEIGVRMALGAQRFDVLKLVVKKGIVLGVVGVAVGLAASFALTRLIATLLFEVTATDKTTFAVVSVGLFVVTLLACYVPARRATKVDPMKALRYE